MRNPSHRVDRVSLETLGDVVAELNEGVLIAAADGEVRYANPAALELLGLNLLGGPPQRLQELLPAFEVHSVDGRPLGFEDWPISRALLGERIVAHTCVFSARDGGRRWIRCSGGLIDLDDGPGGWVCLRDVTLEETAARELREEHDLVAGVLGSSPLAIAVVRTPALTFELVNDAFASLRPEVRLPGRPVLEAFPEAPGTGYYEVVEQVAATGETITDVDRPIDFLGPQVRYLTFSVSRLPQMPGRTGRVLIVVQDTTEAVVSRARVEQGAAARAEEQAAARAVADRLRGMVGLAQRMGLLEDVGGLIRLVSRELRRLLEADVGAVLLLEDDGRALVTRAADGLPADAVGLHLPVIDFPELAEVLHSGRVAVHMRADEHHGPERPLIQRFGVRSYALVRIGSAERPMGILVLAHVQRRHRYTRAELDFAEALAGFLAVSLERTRLAERLRQAAAAR